MAKTPQGPGGTQGNPRAYTLVVVAALVARALHTGRIMPRRLATILIVRSVLVGGSVVALAGCGSTQQTRVTPAPHRGAGGSWNAVLPGAAVAGPRTLDTETPAWVLSRNDDHLNPRSVDPVLATEAWPEPDRPSLQRPVLIRVYETPGRYYSYRPDRRRNWRDDRRY